MATPHLKIDHLEDLMNWTSLACFFFFFFKVNVLLQCACISCFIPIDLCTAALKSQHAKAVWEKSHLLESCVSSQSLSHCVTTAVSNHRLHTPTALSLLTQTPYQSHPHSHPESQLCYFIVILFCFLGFWRSVDYLTHFSNSLATLIIIITKLSKLLCDFFFSYTLPIALA